jgi:hypothetical protein
MRAIEILISIKPREHSAPTEGIIVEHKKNLLVIARRLYQRFQRHEQLSTVRVSYRMCYKHPSWFEGHRRFQRH